MFSLGRSGSSRGADSDFLSNTLYLSHVISGSCVHSILCLFVELFACPFERCTSIPSPSQFRLDGMLSCPMRCFVSSVAVRFFPQSVQSADPRLLQRRLIAKYVFACRFHLNLVTLQSHCYIGLQSTCLTQQN